MSRISKLPSTWVSRSTAHAATDAANVAADMALAATDAAHVPTDAAQIVRHTASVCTDSDSQARSSFTMNKRKGACLHPRPVHSITTDKRGSSHMVVYTPSRREGQQSNALHLASHRRFPSMSVRKLTTSPGAIMTVCMIRQGVRQHAAQVNQPLHTTCSQSQPTSCML